MAEKMRWVERRYAAEGRVLACVLRACPWLPNRVWVRIEDRAETCALAASPAFKAAVREGLQS